MCVSREFVCQLKTEQKWLYLTSVFSFSVQANQYLKKNWDFKNLLTKNCVLIINIHSKRSIKFYQQTSILNNWAVQNTNTLFVLQFNSSPTKEQKAFPKSDIISKHTQTFPFRHHRFSSSFPPRQVAQKKPHQKDQTSAVKEKWRSLIMNLFCHHARTPRFYLFIIKQKYLRESTKLATKSTPAHTHTLRWLCLRYRWIGEEGGVRGGSVGGWFCYHHQCSPTQLAPTFISARFSRFATIGIEWVNLPLFDELRIYWFWPFWSA